MSKLQVSRCPMPQSCPRSTLEVCLTPAGCLAPGDPRIYCLRQRRQSPDLSAAPVIPTRIKSASTTAIWTSSGSTLLNARCPMECRATEDLSESDVLSVGNQLNMRGQRLSAVCVLCLAQTLSAMTFVCQAPCRLCPSGVFTESQALDDSLTPLHLHYSSREWTLHSLFGTLASTGTLTLKQRTLEFDTAGIPLHHNSWSKFHQAGWFQDLSSKFNTDPWRRSPFLFPPESHVRTTFTIIL